MTGTDVARFTHKQSRSYLNHLVYMCVCIHIYMYVCVCIYIYVLYIYIYMCVCIYMCMFVCVYIYVCVCICVCVCVYACMFVCIYKVVQIWPGLMSPDLHTNSPGHIWTTLYICIYIYMYVCVCLCIYICVYACIYVYVCVYMCVCVCVCGCVYALALGVASPSYIVHWKLEKSLVVGSEYCSGPCTMRCWRIFRKNNIERDLKIGSGFLSHVTLMTIQFVCWMWTSANFVKHLVLKFHAVLRENFYAGG